MAANTLTLTGNNAAAISRLGKAISRAAATAQVDNRAVGTFTVLDTSTALAPWTLTYTDAAGVSHVEVIG